MVYLEFMRNKWKSAIVVLSAVAVFCAVFPAASYGATKPVDAQVTNLYVDTNVSQANIPESKSGYRRVRLSWKTTGTTTPTSYNVYLARKRKVVTKTTEKVKVTKKVKTENPKTHKTEYKKVTTYKTKTVKKTSYQTKFLRIANVRRTSRYLYIKNKDCQIRVVPKTPSGSGTPMTRRVYAGENNATTIAVRGLPDTLVERSAISIYAASDSSKDSDVTLSSSNMSVANVSSNGIITPVKVGKFQIVATAHNGLTKKITMRVIPMYPESVKISGKSSVTLKKGKTLSLSTTTSEANNKTLSWKTSSKSVVTVTSAGKLKAVGTGSATITVTAGSFSDRKPATAKIKVTVNGDVDGMLAWAKKIAADNRYGYSMGVVRGRGLDRFCYTCHGSKVSKDYDCASFVAAAVAHGTKNKNMLEYCRVSGGCTGLYNTLKKNGWKDMGKLSSSKLKKGDILINPSAHVEIYTGEKNSFGQYLNVGAHRNYDGRSGDSTGKEISLAPTMYFNTPWHHYTHVLRYTN